MLFLQAVLGTAICSSATDHVLFLLGDSDLIYSFEAYQESLQKAIHLAPPRFSRHGPVHIECSAKGRYRSVPCTVEKKHSVGLDFVDLTGVTGGLLADNCDSC